MKRHLARRLAAGMGQPAAVHATVAQHLDIGGVNVVVRRGVQIGSAGKVEDEVVWSWPLD